MTRPAGAAPPLAVFIVAGRGIRRPAWCRAYAGFERRTRRRCPLCRRWWRPHGRRRPRIALPGGGAVTQRTDGGDRPSALDPSPHPGDGRGREGGRPGRRGGHRQSRFLPPCGPSPSGPPSRNSDRRLCVADRLGMAPGAGCPDGSLRRPSPRHPSLRAGGSPSPRAGRPAPMSGIRSSRSSASSGRRPASVARSLAAAPDTARSSRQPPFGNCAAHRPLRRDGGNSCRPSPRDRGPHSGRAASRSMKSAPPRRHGGRRPTIVVGEDAKFAAFRRADAALAASGTVTLELALSGVPMVVAYRLDPLGRRFKWLISTPSIVLANLVLGENAFQNSSMASRRLAISPPRFSPC